MYYRYLTGSSKINTAVLTSGPARDELVRRLVADPQAMRNDRQLLYKLYAQFKESFGHPEADHDVRWRGAS
jgi:hypothetical protein